MTSPVRNSMKYQYATVTRKDPGPVDPLGNPGHGSETTWAFPCRAWEATETAISGDGKHYSVTVLKARVPLDAAVLEGDRLEVDGMSGEVESVVTRNRHKVVKAEVYH